WNRARHQHGTLPAIAWNAARHRLEQRPPSAWNRARHRVEYALGFMVRYMGLTSEADRLRLAGTSDAAERLAKILPTITAIEPTQEQQKRAASIMRTALLAEMDLDAGEVGLLAVAVDLLHAEIATGDKRALRCMPAIAKIEQSLLVLRKRLICFEQLISQLCRKFGMQRLRTAVTTCPSADETLAKAYTHYGSKDVGVFVNLMNYAVQEQIEKPAPGWLKSI
ncbi:hypothetical protein, partial [Ramlibacter sp.]|uniref:hypothetical protein n=1 Tax=Ramlibacter sp. TaxID=1917967 RepID=UPI003D14BB5D